MYMKLLSLGKRYLSEVVMGGGLLILIILLLSSGWEVLATKIGMNTKTALQTQLAQERTNNEQLNLTVQELTATLAASAAISAKNIAAVEVQLAVKATQEVELKTSIRTKDRTISGLRGGSSDVQPSELPPTAEEIEISSVQINSVWDKYCSVSGSVCDIGV